MNDKPERENAETKLKTTPIEGTMIDTIISAK